MKENCRVAYIFLDESGQFTKHDNCQYFIIGSFTVGDQRRTEKRFRAWQREKFPRKLRNQAEIKFSEVNITDDLRLKTLKMISNLDVRINYTFLLRDNIPETYRDGKKIHSGALYTHAVGETLEMYLPIHDLDLRVFCDRRNLKGLKTIQFKTLLKDRLAVLLPSTANVQIEMIDSTSNSNIQIADWIAGALARYYNKKELGEEFYKILKNNIVGDKELFENHWQKTANKKSGINLELL